jgi:hypothetical protein
MRRATILLADALSLKLLITVGLLIGTFLVARVSREKRQINIPDRSWCLFAGGYRVVPHSSVTSR